MLEAECLAVYCTLHMIPLAAAPLIGSVAVLACVQEGHKRVSAEPSLEDLARFHAVSPIAHIGNVKAPMVFMLGAKDRRVPLDDGWR